MTRLKLWLSALLVGLVVLAGWGRAQRNDGARKAITDMKGRDHENAADIRDRVEREHADRVSAFANRGYRD